MMRIPVYRVFFPVLAALLAAGCRWPNRTEAPKPLQERVTWCGKTVSTWSDSIPSDTGRPEACIRILRLEFAASETPFRMELRRYRDPRWAFSAWQTLAAGARSLDGCARVDSRWTFVHGQYLGLTDSSASNLYPEEFKERLAFAGETSFALPAEFGAFPLRGRIPGSERIFPRDFLGGPWRGPVFSVAYQCHGDTALAFRGTTQLTDSIEPFLAAWTGKRETRKSGKEWSFEGRDEFGRPIFLDHFAEGMLGISGCYDPFWTREYAEKMRKTQVFWKNP